MEQRKLKVGIIGCGRIAGAHAISYNKMDDVEVVGLADIIPGKAKAFAEQWGLQSARLYDNHLDLLENEELDGVSICTYNMQHAVCAIDALNRGINVVIEKPMCVTMEEAYAMVRAEIASGKVLSIGFQPRYSAQMKKMKEIVRSGALGKVYYIQTGGGRRRGIPDESFIDASTGGIGALGDIGCYAIDMVLDAIDYPMPLTVTGYTSDWFGKNPKQYPNYYSRFGVDDFGAGFIRLAGDVILDFRIAWAMNVDSPGDTIILGTEGGLRIPATDCWNGGFNEMTLYKTVNGKNIQEKIPREIDPDPDIFYLKVRAFIDAVKNGTKSPVPTSQILKNQAILSGIVTSMKLGKEIKIEFPEDILEYINK